MVHCVVHLQLTQHCKSATSITKDTRSFHPVITFTHRWSCGIGYKVFHWVTLGHYCLRLGHRGSGKNKWSRATSAQLFSSWGRQTGKAGESLLSENHVLSHPPPLDNPMLIHVYYEMLPTKASEERGPHGCSCPSLLPQAQRLSLLICLFLRKFWKSSILGVAISELSFLPLVNCMC